MEAMETKRTNNIRRACASKPPLQKRWEAKQRRSEIENPTSHVAHENPQHNFSQSLNENPFPQKGFIKKKPRTP